MSKVIQGTFEKTLELDRCAGCGCEIDSEYTEVVLPMPFTPKKKHIALCPSCSSVAERKGVL